MKRLLLIFLSACSADIFTSFEGGLPKADSSSESSTDADSGVDPQDAGGLDAREAGEESSADAKPDGPCPTGVSACDDAITSFCSRMKACCAGQCMYAWANAGGSQCVAQFSTGGCSGKMICETACLSDVQAATCTTIKNSPSPAYVASSCWSLWQ